MNYRRIANVVGLLALIVVVVPFVVYAVPGVVGADHSFVVLSGSMEPELSPGDGIVVAETDPATIEEGDVITYTKSGGETTVTHRVVDVREDDSGLAFETKGDANDDPDQSLVRSENVVGTVVLTIPFIGHVIQFVDSPAGFGLLVALPFGLLIATELWSFVGDAVDQNDGEDGGSSGGELPGIPDPSRTDERSDPAAAVPVVAAAASEPPSLTDFARDQFAESSSADEHSADSTVAGASRESGGESGITVPIADLTVSLCLLAVLTPYSAYVAFRLQTVATLTVAFAVAFSTLALGSLRFALWFDGRETEARDDGPPTSDGSSASNESSTSDGLPGDRAVGSVEPIDLGGPALSDDTEKPTVVADVLREGHSLADLGVPDIAPSASDGDEFSPEQAGPSSSESSIDDDRTREESVGDDEVTDS